MRLVLPIAALALIISADAQPHDWRAALDFEVPGAWTSEADLLDEFPEEVLWSTRRMPFAELAGGVTLSDEHVKSGQFAGRWADHPRFPTIHCRAVPADWSRTNGIAFQAFSEVATGERITFGVASDSEATPYHDWLFADFVVDWTGWREIALPLSAFRPLGSPVGWNFVQGIYLFTKIFDRQPNPYTVLHLDAMRLLDNPVAQSSAAPEVASEHAIPIISRTPDFDPAVMNHPWPELREAAVAPILYMPYFKKERALGASVGHQRVDRAHRGRCGHQLRRLDLRQRGHALHGHAPLRPGLLFPAVAAPQARRPALGGTQEPGGALQPIL